MMRLLGSRLLPVLGLLLLVAGLTGCPSYPKCKKDKDCHPNEYCVNGLCQQCRNNTDCAQGQECKEGRCQAIPGYCTDDSQCPPNQACIDNRCRACTSDADCGPNGKCKNGRCLRNGACDNDEDCPAGQSCIGGRCQTPPAPPKQECSLESVYFDFDKSDLRPDALTTLDKDVACLKEAGRAVILEGHCDPRGTEEYNMALSERRGQSVRSHLTRLGIGGDKMRTLPRGKIDATGTDEESWARDRRVDLKWQ